MKKDKKEQLQELIDSMTFYDVQQEHSCSSCAYDGRCDFRSYMNIDSKKGCKDGMSKSIAPSVPTPQERDWMEKELRQHFMLFDESEESDQPEIITVGQYKFYDPIDFVLNQSVLNRKKMSDVYDSYFPFKNEIDFTGKKSKFDYDQYLTDKFVTCSETKNFVFCHSNEQCYILNKKTNVQVTGYKIGHIGRANTVSKNGKNIDFSIDDGKTFASQIRQDFDFELSKQKKNNLKH